jgi:hypothetical protein
MATNWVDEVLSGATSTGSKTVSLATGNALSVANTDSEKLFTVTSDTANGGFTSILGIDDQEAVLFLGADLATNETDVWSLEADTTGNFKLGIRTSGTASPTRSNTITSKLIVDTNSEISLSNNDAGTSNTIFGKDAGDAITSGGNYNSIFGDDAGTALTTGDNNAFIGRKAGYASTTGGYNVAIGASAMGAGVTSTEIGNNVAIGYIAGADITTGVSNTLIGSNAGKEITEGNSNTALGTGSLQANLLSEMKIQIMKM